MKLSLSSSLIAIAAFAFLLTASIDVLALSSDRDQAAQIEADETEINFKTGTRVLTDNVLVVQGTLRVKADNLVANYNKQGELIKAIADGSLARFKQRPDDQPDDVEGWAKKIIIDYPSNTITLIGKAALKQGGSTARGNKIVYNMATDKLKIMGGSEVVTAGKNGESAPQRKIKDPFADDTPTTKASTEKATSSTSLNAETNQANTATEAQKNSEPKIEPIKSGRSRLILQPRKKVKKDKNIDDLGNTKLDDSVD